MRTLFATGAAIAGLMLAAPAFAQGYGSIGYSSLSTDTGGFDLDAVDLKAGWSPGVVGVEGEALIGVGDDTVGGNTAELNYGLGVFGTVRGELTPDFTIFGRAGYGTAEAEVNGISGDDDGPAYGAGLIWSPGGGMSGLRVDYTKYDFDTVEADGWSVGFNRRF